MTETRTVPKYLDISRQIVEQINRGELGLGAQVPSENELISSYSISNTTARKVLLELERGGWVTRIKGRGTYVRQNRVERSVNRILSFTRNMLEAGLTPSTRLLGIRVLREPRSLLVHGREYRLGGPMYEVRRLRFADDLPMMMETRYVSMHLCPGLDRRDLEGSLYDIYERDYGLQMTRIDQILSAAILEREDLSAFELDSPIPAFRVEGVTFLAKELILEIEESLYRGDAYRFYVTATR
jgi:GntR family transcriptional regulator